MFVSLLCLTTHVVHIVKEKLTYLKESQTLKHHIFLYYLLDETFIQLVSHLSFFVSNVELHYLC